jgi:hypothetical protein
MTLLHWARPAVALRPAQLGFPGPFGLSAQEPEQGRALGFTMRWWPAKSRRRGPVGGGGFWEQAGRAADRIWGRRRGGGSPEGLVRGGVDQRRGRTTTS